MIFGVRVWFHIQIILIAFDSFNNLHVARLEIRLESQIILLKGDLILDARTEDDIFGFFQRVQVIHPFGMYGIIDIPRTASNKCKLIILPEYIIALLCNCSPSSRTWLVIIFDQLCRFLVRKTFLIVRHYLLFTKIILLLQLQITLYYVKLSLRTY